MTDGGRVLTAEDCLKQAQECIAQAEAASDPVVRDEFLKLATRLTETAARLEQKSNVVDIDEAPSAVGEVRKGFGSDLTE